MDKRICIDLDEMVAMATVLIHIMRARTKRLHIHINAISMIMMKTRQCVTKSFHL